ncbi:MAG: HEAT repeat domain-containing protein [Candidatus Hydrogenedentes bacterium]|nr:HEAT repeat domain-containing protein [Candidatus Hydrogenedentota bacterium]
MRRTGAAHGLVLLCYFTFYLVSPRQVGAADHPDRDLAWCAEDRYLPPNFEGFFPDSAQGAAELAALWAAPNRDEADKSRVFATVRQGFRHYRGDRAELLRWLGRRFVEGQSTQDGNAVEIMYHALDIDQEQAGAAEARSAALRFGVSVVRPLPPNVLRALAALSLASEDGDELSRVVWAIADQRSEALAILDDYTAHGGDVDREKLAIIRKLWNRELKAQDWVRDRNRARALDKFGDRLPEILRELDSGTSDGRNAALEFVQRNDVLPILPESVLAAFSRCASDSDPRVRALAARLIGERWVLAATHMHPRAVDTLLKLSRDEAALVRHNAIYYGLAAVSPKDEEVIIRLLEVASTESDTALYERIKWGLRASRPQVRALLNAWRTSSEPSRVALSARLYHDLAG